MYAEPVNVIEEKTLKGTVNVISKCKVSMPRSFFFFFFAFLVDKNFLRFLRHLFLFLPQGFFVVAFLRPYFSFSNF